MYAMVDVLIKMPEEMHRDLVNVMDRRGLSRSAVIRYAVSKFLDLELLELKNDTTKNNP